MKANQAFRANDEAVSPVIGVILMVAITVVLAAVVFVLVSNLGKGNQSAPTFALQRDDATDRLSVTSADSDADWNRLAVKITSTVPAGACVSGNQDVQAATCAADADAFAATTGTNLDADNTELTGTANLMSAGEYIEFCATALASGVTVVVVDTTANSVIGTFTFNDIAAC